MSYTVEICNNIWEQVSVHPTIAEARKAADEWAGRGWGTASIRITKVVLEAVKERTS